MTSGSVSDVLSQPDSATKSEPAQHKTNNPFAPRANTMDQKQAHTTGQPLTLAPQQARAFPNYRPTSIPREKLRSFPFKTLNRILDDLKFTAPLLKLRKSQSPPPSLPSLLNARPIEYSKLVSQYLVHEGAQTLVLNNAVNFIEPVSKRELELQNVTLVTVRGLLVSKDMQEVKHFKVLILEKLSRSPFATVDKQEYHVTPKELITQDDLEILGGSGVESENVLDDAFFVSYNSPMNHVMRISVYDSEFSAEDMKNLTDTEIIEKRYLEGIENNPVSNLKADLIPSPVHCFQTLIKVLKGPILLPPNDPIHTISKLKTSLDAKIDLSILFDKLGFKLGEDSDSLIPPDLSKNASLREQYIRKAYELIFVGKNIKLKNLNDFDVTYSFSDNLSQIHAALGEVDKHSGMSLGRTDNCNKLPFYINLSCSTFYQDELIIRCYENTVNSDPANKIFYVDSFKNLMSYRSSSNSSRLLSYYNNQYMKGLMYGHSDYRALLMALKIEGVDYEEVIDPDVIIEMYNVACKSDPKNYTYYNKQLRIISSIRSSDKLTSFLATELVPTSIALNELRIEELTEDEVVVTAFEFRLDEVMQSSNFDVKNPDVVFLQRCLLSIAVGRKSYILMNYIESKLPDLKQELHLSFADALRVLEILEDTNEFEIISSFQAKLTKSNFGDDVDIRTLREAFTQVAEEKKLMIMLSFLKQGKVDPSLLPPESWPTGLDNIGNTCYLNSLLQYYFCIKPLRETILAFDRTVTASNQKRRKIGGRFVEESELERSSQFIFRLQNLFQEMISTRRRCVQPSKELAYLSFLPLSQPVSFKQHRFQAETIEEVEDSEMEIDDKENDAIVVDSTSPEPMQVENYEKDFDLIELDSEKLEEPEPQPVHIENADEAIEEEEPKILSINTDQIESTIEVGRQQDVTECIENVTFQIETALEPERIEDDGEQYDLIKRLFSGKTKQTITPLDPSSSQKQRSSIERFFSLIINVGDHPKDIYDALDNYFSEDVVALEEGEVKKSHTISELPQVLQFHIQRVLFDRERLVPYKSLEVIPFGEKIYLDRYLETDDEEIKAKRQEVFEWKLQMKELYTEKDQILQVDPETKMSVVDALRATVKYLETRVVDSEQLSIKPETINVMKEQIDSLKSRLQTINDQLNGLQDKVSSQFSSYQKTGYSLFAIFIHRGEASYGHYWVYIKDPHKNVYRKYNDDNVTEVPASEVLNFSETNTATPYYVVYVKDDLEEDYIEPLKREIV